MFRDAGSSGDASPDAQSSVQEDLLDFLGYAKDYIENALQEKDPGAAIASLLQAQWRLGRAIRTLEGFL